MVARLHRGDARADFAHDARAFMAEDRREDALAVEAIERIGVGVADAGRHDLDQNFAGLGSFQIQLDDLERFLRLESDGGACLHGDALSPLARPLAASCNDPIGASLGPHSRMLVGAS